MCRYKKLRVGDRIRFSRMPALDREQFERTGDDSTVRVLRRLIDGAVVCTVSKIDEHGSPWFDHDFVNDAGEEEYHSLVVMDDDSWEKVGEAI